MLRTDNRRYTAHRDSFCADRLPNPEQLPVIFRDLPEYCYPERLNCAAELLDRMVESGEGNRTAFIHESGCWTYQQLLEGANRIAHALVDDLGLLPGNRVLLRGPNHPIVVACWFGVVKAGGIAVATSCLLRCRELIAIADKANISLAICDGRYADECMAAFTRRGDEESHQSSRVVLFNCNPADSLEALIATKPSHFTNCDTSAEDIAIIAFTSGSTGQGKGTMHTHRDLLAAADCFPRYVLRPDRDDIFIGTPPLAFTYALGGLLLFPMRTRANQSQTSARSNRSPWRDGLLHCADGISRNAEGTYSRADCELAEVCLRRRGAASGNFRGLARSHWVEDYRWHWLNRNAAHVY